MMRRFVPYPCELGLHVDPGRIDQEGIRWQQCAQCGGRIRRVRGPGAVLYGKDAHAVGLTCRSLSREIEVAEVNDVVARELRAHRLRHAETVQVDDTAAHTVLPYVLEQRHALEPHRVELGNQVTHPPDVT